jgi:hypothetical protein
MLAERRDRAEPDLEIVVFEECGEERDGVGLL